MSGDVGALVAEARENVNRLEWEEESVALANLCRQLADALIAATEREQRVRAAVAELEGMARLLESRCYADAASMITAALDTAERGTLGATTATDAGGERA